MTQRHKLAQRTIYCSPLHSCTPDVEWSLSVKCMFNGQAIYQTAEGRYVVDDDGYLILNEGQPYSLSKESASVETFCIFFPATWAQDVAQALTVSSEWLLDTPNAPSVSPVHFFQKRQPDDHWVMPHIRTIRTQHHLGVLENGWLAETLHQLLADMLHIQRMIYRETEQLPAVRYATRVELYQRLHLARDYMHASLDEPLDLNHIAQIARLSPYHFLRSFKSVFGQTPHAYLTKLRLARAQHLLLSTDRSITDICFDVGFESLGSFSTLFRRNFGLSPRQFRQQNQR